MSTKVKQANIGFRPHFKTHQSIEIGNWFRDFGVTGITVSSFDMAEYFAQAGWLDILVAFPFNPLEMKRLNELASISRISVLADNIETISTLQKLEKEVGFYIDIDTGYGRTGIRSDQFQQIEDLLSTSRQNPKLDFSGFYCHAGHSYKARSRTEQDEIHQKAISDLAALKKHFAGYDPRVLFGDTPNCSIQTDFQCVDEITPGNFVFYDLTQVSIGSCDEADIAVAMVCPVTGKYPDSHQILIHGGAVHFSKETLPIKGQLTYGKLVHFTQSGWSPMQDGSYITSLTQEHGVLIVAGELFERTRIGDLMAFSPVHSCLTANLMKQYTTLEGKVITML
jgi:D-serine deaminase-like pyridoxal phosphate-dependent protein